MECPHCRREIAEKARRCPLCGETLPRKGLGKREWIAFGFLTALGEDSAQMKARVVAGYAAGNDRAVLIAAIVQLLPFIAWPRALSALTVLNETDRELNDDGYDDDPF